MEFGPVEFGAEGDGAEVVVDAVVPEAAFVASVELVVAAADAEELLAAFANPARSSSIDTVPS